MKAKKNPHVTESAISVTTEDVCSTCNVPGLHRWKSVGVSVKLSLCAPTARREHCTMNSVAVLWWGGTKAHRSIRHQARPGSVHDACLRPASVPIIPPVDWPRLSKRRTPWPCTYARGAPAPARSSCLRPVAPTWCVPVVGRRLCAFMGRTSRASTRGGRE